MNRNRFQEYLDSLPTRLNESGVKKIMKLQEAVKINLYPGKMGVDVEGDPDGSEAVVELPLSDIHLNEPASKMFKTDSKKNVLQLKKVLDSGKDLDPILVMKDSTGYKILDGHHRYTASKLAKRDTINAIVIPAEDITKVDSEGNPLK